MPILTLQDAGADSEQVDQEVRELIREETVYSHGLHARPSQIPELTVEVRERCQDLVG